MHYTSTPSDYSQESLELFVDNIKEDRSDLDLLFDCMLRWGITSVIPPVKVKEVSPSNIETADVVGMYKVDLGVYKKKRNYIGREITKRHPPE